MGVVWVDKNDRRGAPRRPSARLVTGRDLSAALLLGQRRPGEGRPSPPLFPVIFRRRSIEWSPLRAALRTLARQP